MLHPRAHMSSPCTLLLGPCYETCYLFTNLCVYGKALSSEKGHPHVNAVCIHDGAGIAHGNLAYTAGCLAPWGYIAEITNTHASLCVLRAQRACVS